MSASPSAALVGSELWGKLRNSLDLSELLHLYYASIYTKEEGKAECWPSF